MSRVRLEREERDDALVLRLDGEIDLSNADELAVAVRHEVTNTTLALALDLRGLTYLDSAGVRLLFDLAGRLRLRRQELVVVAEPGTLLADVLRMVAIDHVAIVADDVDSGLARVRVSPAAE